MIEVWGNGSAVRSYTFVDDMVEGVYQLMQSDLEGPVNIGSSEYVTVDELVQLVAATAGKDIRSRYVEGPVGVRSRNFSHRRVESLGWRAPGSAWLRASPARTRGLTSKCGALLTPGPNY